MTAMDRPRKILMTTDTVGGVWTYAVDLCAALDAAGIQVLLAAMGGRTTRHQREALGSLTHVQLAENPCKLEWMPQPWPEVDNAGQWLLDLAASFHPDLVHLNNYCHGQLPWPCPVVMVGHSCVLSWWQAVKKEPAPSEWAEYHQRVQSGLQAANRIVAPTAAMANSLSTHYGPFPNPVEVIPNFRRLPDIPPVPKENFILAAGRLWDEAKNTAALCEVAPDLSWPVLLAGDNGEASPPDLKNVSLLGPLPAPEIHQLMSRSALYAFPARYEPFGLSILEAATFHCPLVLGNIPSLREIWDGAAVFVHPEDPHALAHALHQLIEDPLARKSLASKAASRAGRFTEPLTLKAYLQLYRSLLPPPASAVPIASPARDPHPRAEVSL